MKTTILLILFIFSINILLFAEAKIVVDPKVELLDTLYKDLTIEQSDSLIKANETNINFIIIDVRRPDEFVISHLENSVNIDFYSEIFSLEISKLDKQKKYLIYCRVTNRSGQTLDLMRQFGFHEVYRMYGGITEWVEKGYPYAIGTNVQNKKNTENVKLYPNPSSDFINIEISSSEGYLIELINTDGKLIFKRNYKNSNLPIYIGDNAKGIYLCKITSNKKVSLLKFCVE